MVISFIDVGKRGTQIEKSYNYNVINVIDRFFKKRVYRVYHLTRSNTQILLVIGTDCIDRYFN